MGVLDWVKVFCGVVSGMLSWLFGGVDALLIALVLLIVIDYITGLAGAWVYGKLNSRVGFCGILKKLCILSLVVMAHFVDVAIGTNYLREVVIGFFIANEGISILENAGKVGVPIPKKLKDVLEQLNDEGDG